MSLSNGFGPSGAFGPAPPVGPPGPPGAPLPPGPPPPPRGNNTGVVIAIVAVLALVVVPAAGLVLWLGLAAGDHSTSSSSTSGGTSSTGGSTGGDDGTSGDDAEGAFTPSPTPDPTASAFDAIRAGDCLALWDTGYGGDTIDWSSDVPPDPLPSCEDKDAMVRVTAVGDSVADCATGTGRSYWAYLSPSDHRNRVLCLSRVYRTYYCLLGIQKGEGANARISIGPMTAVDCEAERVPLPYNQIMHITGVYRAPPGASADNCVQGPGDTRYYWAWKVDGGETLLCTTIFQR